MSATSDTAQRALSEHRGLRFVVFGLLYAVQGISDAMVLIVFPAFLATHHVAPAAIGTFLGIALLPNAAKLALGPLVDRWSYRPMGRRKPWIMLGELGIAASFAFLALLTDPVAHLALFAAGAFAITLATALQDVATDATAMDVLPSGDQGRANGIMWGAKTFGTAMFAALGALVLDRFGFAMMAGSAVIVVASALCGMAAIRERPGERLLPWTRGSAVATSNERTHARHIVRQLLAALRRPGARRMVALSLVIGVLLGLAGALAPIMMVERLGWSQAGYAHFRAVLKLVSGLAGMAIGGWQVDRVGARSVLLVSLAGIAIASLVLATMFSASLAAIYLAVFESLLVFAFIAFFAATMRECQPAIAATQFSFTMVCGNLSMALGARLVGPLLELGREPAAAAVLAGAALVGASLFARKPHQGKRGAPQEAVVALAAARDRTPTPLVGQPWGMDRPTSPGE